MPHSKKTKSAKPARKTKKSGSKPASKLASKPVRPVRELDRPAYFINRELSWLEFNQRVLEEAQDATNPLLERLKFLTIVASNLDEFFEVRVAGLQQQEEARPVEAGPDGLTATQTLQAIAERVNRLLRDQYRCYRDEIAPGLAVHGIDLLTVADLDEAGHAWTRNYFEGEVFPALTPLAIDPSHPFPQLLNKSLNLVVSLSVPETNEDAWEGEEPLEPTRFGVVQVPRVLPRLVALPSDVGATGRRGYVFLSSIISEHVGRLFSGLRVEGCYAFRVTRNSELYLDEDEADNLLEAMQEQVSRRRKGRGDAVRLEVQRGCDPAVVELLLQTFELGHVDLYEVDGPINLTRLMAVYSAEKRPDLKDRPFKSATPPALRQVENADEFFAAIRHEDILLHHPYDSFKNVIDFIRLAADDPHVLAIKQTLYRTSGDSPIVRALMHAAENGKQVTALVELKARFDEENNILWARHMEEAGVHVLYGLVGLKTHCKMALVVRREEAGLRRYVHLGTGNYNEITARLYTDWGLLTARRDVGEDVAKIFNLLTGMGRFPGLDKLWMAPFGMRENFLRLIERETAHARRRTKKKTPPRLIAQMNSLVDPDVIQALYRASQAGVQIDLVVRGICCLRPGVPGVSDNIRVRSIVDRFLEHPRLYYFANNGAEELYAGSADWMPRNFIRRVETIFPIEDAALRAQLKDTLQVTLADNVKARRLRPDGTYERVPRRAGETPLRLQEWLLEKGRAGAEHAPDFRESRPAAPPGVPATATLPGLFEIVPRPAPQAAPTAEGRAGTNTDPVLQSLAAEVRAQERTATEAAAASENERSNITAAVTADESASGKL